MNPEWLGTVAGMLTTGSFAPQAWKIFRTRRVEDISSAMYVAFVCGVTLWIAYGLSIGSYALVISNLITLLLAGSILLLKLTLGRR